MPEKNWKKVKELFHEALRHDASEREAFLESACGDDIYLRIEVESLLMSLTEATSFLEVPVLGERQDTKFEWQLTKGCQISHYRIVEPIGSGGMGEVYLADDERLGRQVALKILPRHMLENGSRLRRFELEANAVSALNHPNIITIYEFEQANGIHFFASEFVQGVTLRQKLDAGKLSVNKTLEIAIQVVSALYAAHEAGVIHRDIKPENIMIRDDGYVKVLDFGLAKLAENIKAGDSEWARTKRFSIPGMIMGTMTYMSPEQARGTRVDARSDIFSLGVLIYEMLVGQAPFRGETATDVLAEIIQSDPPVPSSIDPGVPTELDEIVGKALSKKTIDRFQDAADLLIRLRDVLKRLEFNAELERSVKQGSISTVQRADLGKLIPEDRVSSLGITGPDNLSPLVGRTKEIDELSDLMIRRRANLVTLTGIGGTGKTRLAWELCQRLEGAFKDGVIFVRLSEVCDASLIGVVIAQKARIQEIIGTPIEESLKDFLRNKQALLVLDNFEQIIESAPFVADLLSDAPQLSILVTSRERLHLQAEIEFNVPPLPIPEAEGPVTTYDLAKIDSVRLFVERSQQANPEFELSDSNASQIAKICSMLDGLPLAIELAAARTRIFSPAMILEKLEARLAFLTGGARDLPERQQTMRATVDWSYDLLNEEEQRLFRKLSVFAAQFTPAAAETISCDDVDDDSLEKFADASTEESMEFLDLFTSLADKSLLLRRKQGKYSLLSIVREYAGTKLEQDDDADNVRLRHARFYLTLAEKAEPYLQSGDSAAWIGRLEEDHENLRAALLWSIRKEPQIAARLAAAIRHFWLIRGHLSEAMKWAEEILDQDIDMPPEIRWKILTLCGNISQFQGDIDSAFEFYEKCLSAARLSGKQTHVARSLRGLGALAYLKYDFVTARTLLIDALTISKKASDEFGRAASLARLGDIANAEGDLTTARELTSEALAVFRRIGYAEGVSAKLYNLGAIVFLDGDHETARSYFEEADATARDLGEKINTRLIFDGFAALAAEDGDYTRAARLAGAAESLGATIGYAVEPAERIFREAYLGKLRAAMPDHEFATEHEVGRKMTTAEAREFAHPQAKEAQESLNGSSKAPGLHSIGAVSKASESINGILARVVQYQNVVLAVLLSALLLATAVMLALWMWSSN